MRPTPRTSRRDVLRFGATAAILPAFPTIVPARVFRAGSPSDTLRIALIGCGRRGRQDIFPLLDRGLEAGTPARVVAVCDVDRGRAAIAKADLEKRYAEKLEGAPANTIDVYTDHLELLAREDIDAVVIATPDHWHALGAIAAARAGKHIYLEKPMTYSIAEGRALVRAVRESGVVLQVGSQQRSHPSFRRAAELVRNEVIGELQKVEVYLPPDSGEAAPVPGPVPEGLDYDAWCGPTMPVEYAELGVHPQSGFGRPGWLQRQRYCFGMITGWGSHMNDAAQWGHGGDHDSGPVRYEATAEFPERGLFNVHTNFRAECAWADGVPLIQETGPQAGVRFTGPKGSIWVQRYKVTSEPTGLVESVLPDDAVRLYESGDHYRNWLECVRTGAEPICPVEVGHRSNTVCIATHIAMRLGRPLDFDPVTERFVGDLEANALLDYPHRQGWQL
ncbi:MAG: Gfo/Idh/MocA family oxidoreductase [Planctomycetota bacterium]|nr:Gfo/Idh/MocA family oxidoreductase [Planctomycetota bacterium]